MKRLTTKTLQFIDDVFDMLDEVSERDNSLDMEVIFRRNSIILDVKRRKEEDEILEDLFQVVLCRNIESDIAGNMVFILDTVLENQNVTTVYKQKRFAISHHDEFDSKLFTAIMNELETDLKVYGYNKG